ELRQHAGIDLVGFDLGGAMRRTAGFEEREGGCHCGRERFRAPVDLDLLSHYNWPVRTKEGILNLPAEPEDFDCCAARTFSTGVTQHIFCSHCGINAFYVRVPNTRSTPVVSTMSTGRRRYRFQSAGCCPRSMATDWWFRWDRLSIRWQFAVNPEAQP